MGTLFSTMHKISISLLIVLLAACQTNPYGWDRSVEKKVDESMARDAQASRAAVPPDISQALLPSFEAGQLAGRAVSLEPRFDLSVNNAPARQVFMGLVEGTPYSMAVNNEVGGSVTLNLKNATVPDAMQVLRSVYGYEFRRDGNHFMVVGRGMQSRIFPVNYLNLERRGLSQTRVSSGELSQAAGSSSSGGASTGTTGASRPPASTGAQAGASVRVVTDSNADFWKDLQETVATIIGCEIKKDSTGRDRAECKGGRLATVNPQGGMVIVRAMPDELHMVEQFLDLTHATVNRQVILEAKVLEVELKDGYQTGINWAALGGNTTFGMVGGGTIFGGGGVSEIAGRTGVLNPAAYTAISGTNASAFGGVFSAAVKTADFAAFLELLQTQGNVHVLSSPRVSTVNNQKAVIKVGGDEFFVTSATGGTAATISTAATAPTVILTPFFSGISLDVTPQIDEDSNIILHIHPTVSEVQQKDKTFKIADQDFSLPLASSSIQESDNVVRAANGQIIVIGGLMKEGSTDQDASIPFLGDIPILGNAFKHKRVARIKRELVIMLKPTVVDTAQVWESAIQDTQGRIQKLKR